ncbi:GTP-binding protein, partial [Mycena amicta]
MDPHELRKKCPRFRILIIGRANAGKTTLLKKVCMSMEDPEVFDVRGRKLDASVLEGTNERGEHNIENQLVFKSNPGFIFHDSRGFEAGSAAETEAVQAFISRRANMGQLQHQLHAIWYCLPTDTNRPLLKADEDFFNTTIRGKVPLVVIFTKFDALVSRAFQELRTFGHSLRVAHAQKAEKAETTYEEHFVKPLRSTTFPPSDFLHLAGIDKISGSCEQLIEKTALAVTDEALAALFVSVQQINVDLSIQHGLY